MVVGWIDASDFLCMFVGDVSLCTKTIQWFKIIISLPPNISE